MQYIAIVDIDKNNEYIAIVDIVFYFYNIRQYIGLDPCFKRWSNNQEKKTTHFIFFIKQQTNFSLPKYMH